MVRGPQGVEVIGGIADFSAEIRHKPVGDPKEITTPAWLPPGRVAIGLTSGASTPDNLMDAAIRRLDRIANS